MVCDKCVVDVLITQTDKIAYYCKICAESQEYWKKSGAWFLKSLPTFPMVVSTTSAPGPSSPSASSTASFRPPRYLRLLESPTSPTGSLNSLDSLTTTLSVPVSPPAPVAQARFPVNRSAVPPSSLPASPSSRYKLNLCLNKRAGGMR